MGESDKGQEHVKGTEGNVLVLQQTQSTVAQQSVDYRAQLGMEVCPQYC